MFFRKLFNKLSFGFIGLGSILLRDHAGNVLANENNILSVFKGPQALKLFWQLAKIELETVNMTSAAILAFLAAFNDIIKTILASQPPQIQALLWARGVQLTDPLYALICKIEGVAPVPDTGIIAQLEAALNSQGKVNSATITNAAPSGNLQTVGIAVPVEPTH